LKRFNLILLSLLIPPDPSIKVTIRHVAELAGVAPSTVSHYLNRKAPISRLTAQNIERAILALNYSVNLGARSLRLKKTHSVGLVIPNISTPFFAEIAATIENSLWGKGYQTLLCISERDIERELLQCTNLVGRQVDGILLAYNSEKSRVFSFADSSKLPVVFIDRPVPGKPSVSTDHRLGGILMARHLAELGHRKIGILCGEGEIRNVQERVSGFIDELKNWGIEIRDEMILHGLQALQFGLRATELVQKTPRPTAIFATNDIIAMGAWNALLRAGYQVPEDISLASFDDIEVTRFLIPSLTTVAQPMNEIGAQAAELLTSLIKEESATQNNLVQEIVIPPTLIVRESTSPPRT
jgi:LacI family transcriptional regulator